jgi:hypothetical protein
MNEYITKFRTKDGDKQVDYNSLANLPDLSIYASKLEAAKMQNYSYVMKSFSEFTLVTVSPNTVTYASGTIIDTSWESGIHIVCTDSDAQTENIAEEYVVILDFSTMTEIPSIVFDNTIKWFGGEPQNIEAGKVYMFSFTKVKADDNTTLFLLGIGGEFV